MKVYKDDGLKPHKLTHHELKAATCTEAGNIEYWQCSVCNKLFSDEAATKEITDATSLVIPAKVIHSTVKAIVLSVTIRILAMLCSIWRV